MKVCSKCGEEKPLDGFSKSRQSQDGRQGWCKECKRAYYAANRAKEIARTRACYEANRAKNPGKTRIVQGRSSARQRGAVLVERFTFEDVLARDSGACWPCSEPLGEDWHLDHIVPLSQGGQHTLLNVQRLHPACHRLKTAAECRAQKAEKDVPLAA